MTDGAKLVIVKLVHTFIWALFVGMIGFVLYAGIVDMMTRSVLVCAGALAVESAVIVACGWRCPLTLLAYRYTDDRTSAFDIYLPEWLAEHNKTIFGGMYGVGLVLLTYRLLSGG